MSLRSSLKKHSQLVRALEPGKRAMRKDAERVMESQVARVADSLDLDSATREQAPRDPRWDYLLGVHAQGARVVIGVEVHPATAKEAGIVIKKMRTSSELLKTHLVAGSIVSNWYWIASGSVALTGSSREMRLLASAGIKFVGKALRLAELEA